MEWQAGSGQHWTHEEKLTLMKTLGGVATGLDSKGIQQLLQAAYLAGGMTENAGQSLISSIFRSIVDDSRR